MRRQTTRRDFLRTTLATGAAFSFAAPSVLRAGALEERVRIGGVGCGGKGHEDVLKVSVGQDVIALCDVDRRNLENLRKERAPDADAYDDWRRLVDRKDIDAITVSTPDHMHAPIALAAMETGKHVYVQKPLTHDVLEARRMRELAERKGVVTQMGNQGHSGASLRALVQEIQRGVIGKIKEAHAWTDRPIWPQGMTSRPEPGKVPDWLSWDLWIGSAPKRPFAPEAYHPFRWRGWLDFGTGALGDMGCHIIDGIFWSLGLDAPLTIRAEEGSVTSESFSNRSVIRWEFPGTEKTAEKTIAVSWYDGGAHPPIELLPERRRDRGYPKNGMIFVGEKGILLYDRSRAQITPAADFRDWKLPELEEHDHYQQWTRTILGEGKTTSHFGYAGPLTEAVLLGNVAIRFPGEKLEWDGKSARVTNMAKANDFLERKYREGWAPATTAAR